jgi:hypothetical protein
MKILLALICLSVAPAMAATWFGALVDSGCYAARARNVDPNDTLTSVDQDTNEEIRYCSPGAKTKNFGLVDPQGEVCRLDAVGDRKAVEIVRQTGKSSRLRVSVTGELSGKTLKVNSMSKQ